MATDVEIRVKALTDQFTKDINALGDSAKKGLGQAEQASSSLSKSISSNIGALAGLAAGFAGIAGIKAAISSVADFSSAVAEIGTIAGDAVDLNEEFQNQLIDTAAQFGTDATTQAKSFYSIVSAGISDAAKAQETLTAANQLAVGGLAGTEESIDILTSALNVFKGENLGANEAADILFSTVKSGKTTVSELSASLGDALPGAQLLGFSFADAASAVADLTTKGNNTATAVTKLKSIFTGIINVQSKLGKESKAVSDAFDINTVSSRGLEQTLKDIQEATGGSAVELQRLLGSSEAVGGFAALATEGFEGLSKALNGIEAGAAEEAADAIKNTLGFQLEQLQSNFGNLVLKFSQQGGDAITLVVKAINDAILAVINNMDALNAIIGIVTITAGTLFAAFKTGAAIKGIIALIASLKSLNVAAILSKVTIRGAFIATGVGALVVAVGILANEFVKLSDEVGGFGNAAIVVFNLMKSTLATIAKQIIGIVSNIPFIGDKFAEQFAEAEGFLDEIIKEADDSAVEVIVNAQVEPEQLAADIKKAEPKIEAVVETELKPVVDEAATAALQKTAGDLRLEIERAALAGDDLKKFDIAKALSDQFSKIDAAVASGALTVAEGGELQAKAAEAGQKKVLDVIKASFQKQLDEQIKEEERLEKLRLDAVKKAEKARQDALKQAQEDRKKLLQTVGSVLSGIADAFIDAGTFIFDSIVSIFDASQIQGFADKIASPFTQDEETGDFVGLQLKDAFNNLDDVLHNFITNAPDIFSSFLNRFPALLQSVLNQLPELLGQVGEVLSNLFDDLPQILGQILDAIPGLIAKIGDILADLFDKIPGILDKILDKLPEIITQSTEAVVKIIDRLPAIFEKIFEALPSIITSILENLPKVIESLLTAVGKIVASLIRAIPGILVSIIEGLPGIIESLLVGLGEAGGDIAIGFIDFLAEGGVEKIVGAIIRAIPRIIASVVRGAIRSTASILQKLFSPEGFQKLFTSIGPNLQLAFSEAFSAVDFGSIFGGAFGNIAENLTGFFSGIFSNSFLALFDPLIEFFSSIFDFAFQGILPKILEAFNIPVPTWLQSLLDFGNIFSQAPAWLQNLQDQFSKLFETPGWIAQLEKAVNTLTGANLGGEGGAGGAAATVLTGGLNKLAGGIGLQEGGTVPEGFPKDNFPASLTSGELVVPRNDVQRLSDFLDTQGDGGNQAAMLGQIAQLLARPQQVSAAINVDGQALADTILELNRNNARLD